MEKVPEGTYQNNPDSTGVIYGGMPYNQYKDTYVENQQKYPDITECPADKPFFDGMVCVSCPSYQPYFDLNKNQCVNCPTDSSYSAERKECLSTAGATVKTNPNPAKMYASIF